MAVPGGRHARAANAEELLPGIFDEITLNHICTKLPWTDIHQLVFVSRGWLRATRSRQVYDARVRSKSRDSLIVNCVSQTFRSRQELDARVCSNQREGLPMLDDSPTEYIPWIKVFFGIDGNSSFVVPPLANEYFDSIVNAQDRVVALDGKVYVFGGLDRKVHVFDVAGHGWWKQCASVLKPREDFACGVIDGKIYVSGGAVNLESMQEYELYNPKENTWSHIKPIVSLRCSQYTGRVPKKFRVCGDLFYNSDNVPIGMKTSIDGSVRTHFGRRRSGTQ